MPEQHLILSNIDLDVLTDRVAEKVALKLSNATNSEPSPQPQGDFLFNSLKEASDHYNICYQTLSKQLDKIPHLAIGRSIKIYKSDLENAIRKNGILSKERRSK